MTLEYLRRDAEGYLCDLNDWSPEVAEEIARAEHIVLTLEHWSVLNALREFYNCFQLSPTMRPLVKYLRQKTGKENVNSIYLLSLFPGSPAKLAAKIAGLPKPDNCL